MCETRQFLGSSPCYCVKVHVSLHCCRHVCYSYVDDIGKDQGAGAAAELVSGRSPSDSRVNLAPLLAVAAATTAAATSHLFLRVPSRQKYGTERQRERERERESAVVVGATTFEFAAFRGNFEWENAGRKVICGLSKYAQFSVLKRSKILHLAEAWEVWLPNTMDLWPKTDDWPEAK